MGKACSAYWGEEICVKGFAGNICEKVEAWITYPPRGNNIKIGFQKILWRRGLK
jgi:hypothetical protein